MSQAERLKALQAGRQAAAKGSLATSCPYGDGDPARTAWVTGYAGHPNAQAKVDYTS